MSARIDITWHAEDLALLPSRCVWWSRTRTLIVADLHLGKAAAYRASGTPVPENTTSHDLLRLTDAITGTGAARLIVLGDFFHALSGRTTEVMNELRAWRERHSELELVLIRGNHDRRAGDPPSQLSIETVDPGWRVGPFAFYHEPEAADPDAPAFCGHLHPAVRMRRTDSHGLPSLRAPCFWFRERIAILPAFCFFSGSLVVRPRPTDQVFVVGDERILEAKCAGHNKARPGPAARPMDNSPEISLS